MRAFPQSRKADPGAWPSFSRPLFVPNAAVIAPRPCPPTLASSSTIAGIAAKCCARSRATAACSAPMVTCRARRFRKRPRAARHHRAATELVLPERLSSCSEPSPTDWAGDCRTLVVLWGLPAVAMLIAGSLKPLPRAVIWTAMLLWMGGACLANARRCGRTHCRFTGPFFILMAAGVAAYASGLLRLGPHGWNILGAVSLVGAVGICWASERIWGRYAA
jgi:hypothetical protein